MTSEIDIFRTANLLVQAHGADAPIEAARRADDMLDHGDMVGEAVWSRVKLAADVMLSEAGAVH